MTALDERQRTLFRRQNIGFVFQFFNLIPTLTVWENVVLPLELAGVDNGKASHRVEALLDAVGRAINETGERLAKMDEADRPGLVVFVVMTDGLENSSVEFSKTKITDEYGYDSFVADLDQRVHDVLQGGVRRQGLGEVSQQRGHGRQDDDGV